MKATGIICRADVIGRVVIPKEILQNLGIRKGEPLEIYTEGRDTVCFRKYETNLRDEINHLREQIEAYGDLPRETQVRVDILLREVQALVKREEE